MRVVLEVYVDGERRRHPGFPEESGHAELKLDGSLEEFRLVSLENLASYARGFIVQVAGNVGGKVERIAD
jgi:hypothetical protein